MNIYYPENLFKLLKDKWLLLDTNVFIDSFNFDKPKEYISFFNDLKENNTELSTIDGVCFEFLKGSKNQAVYTKKQEHIEDIIDSKLPFRDNRESIEILIKLYGVDGGSMQMVDLHLGAQLLQYKEKIFLMTRDVRDFSQSIFSLQSTVSFSTGKTIFTYGIYTYQISKKKEEGKSDEIPF